MRFRFAEWACDRLIDDADVGKKKIIFSVEAPFDFGGFVNKQNCYIWTQTTRSHTLKSPKLGGATCYTAEAALNVLRHVFEDRIISRRADVVWPPRSCDLTPLDYYL